MSNNAMKDDAREIFINALVPALEKMAENSEDKQKSIGISQDIINAVAPLLAAYDANRLMLGLLVESYADIVAEQARQKAETLEQEVYIDGIFDKYQTSLFLLLDTLYQDRGKNDLLSRVAELANDARARAHHKLGRQKPS